MDRTAFSVLVWLLYVSQKPATAQSGCSTPPITTGVNYNNVGSTAVFAPGANLTYSCSLGWSPKQRPTIRICNADGDWSGTDDVCRIDVPSLVLAVIAGMCAILVVTVVSCFLLTRRRRAERTARRRLTIKQQKENSRRAKTGEPPIDRDGTFIDKHQGKTLAERSDSGLQSDIDDGTNLAEYPAANGPESPTDNNYSEMIEIGDI